MRKSERWMYPQATWRDRLLMQFTLLVVAAELAFCIVPVFV